MKLLIANEKPDTARCLLCAELAFTYSFYQIDSGIHYAQKAIGMSRQIQYKKGEASGLARYGWNLWAAGDYDKAIEMGLKALNMFKALNDYLKVAEVCGQLTVYYRDAGDFGPALKYAKLAKGFYDSLVNLHQINELTGNIMQVQLGAVYLFKNQLDSATYYLNRAYEIEKAHRRESGYVYNLMGYVEAVKRNFPAALEFYRSAIVTATAQNNVFDIGNTYTFLAQLYQETGKTDSSIWYAKQVLIHTGYSIFRHSALDALSILAQDYKLTRQNDSALKYLELRNALNDSLFNNKKLRAIQVLTFNEDLQQQELEAARKQYQNQVRLYVLFAMAAAFLVIGIILYRNNQVKQKVNILLKTQKEKVESTLKVLESTKAQLIQSEKMASLGELTAGIAHEIQNPLNFINNFSDVNRELIEELKTEIIKPKAERDEQAEEEILNNLLHNEEKINHHGKRADAIVKGMLQHSRTSTGQKEPADINALVSEFFKISYHGIRAKDKSFHATMATDFDQSIGKVYIIQQDIGRLLLNLYNNAFYAVSEKQKEKQDQYEPTVSVTTKKADGKVEIIVRDNGNGVSQKVRDKIFQPFFTTKPTGEGTGLGLSLSYDIVKVHGGDIRVNSTEGGFAEFIVQLPV
jgi:signal transduction histidine kinase